VGLEERRAQVQMELEWRRCKKDPEYFLARHWYIKHPEAGRILFPLRDAQREGLHHWMQNRYSLTLKARQIGWSTLVGAYTFWATFFYPDREIILISKGERESRDLLKKLTYGFQHLRPWMRERGPQRLNDNQESIDWSNSSIVKSLPSASDPARGSTAWLIVVDEWAFLPNAEDAWASIEPVADVGGRIIGLSTANGSGNFFHELWVGAETQNNNFKAYFAPWSANTERDEAWYAERQRAMQSWQLAQEFPTTAEEAFIRSGNPVFDLDGIAKHEARNPVVGHLNIPGWDRRAA
jgi:hypothetical protein